MGEKVAELIKTLKLKAILSLYKDLSDRAARENLSYEDYLLILLEEEYTRRKDASIKAKVAKAKFPFVKTIDEFDFSYQPGLRQKELINLTSLSFIDKKENIIFIGPPGVGKTHLSIGIGIKACMAQMRVLFVSAQRLLEELSIAHRDGSIAEKLLYYSRLHLLIIDELGYMPIGKEKANLLFQLISLRYEKASTILTSNYSFDEWGHVFDDPVVAQAIIDRLVHHAHIFPINGESYRIRGKIKRNKQS